VTKSQCRVFNKLRKKEVNRSDVAVVEASDTAITFWVAFPGLFLTYDQKGSLIGSETITERAGNGKPMTPSQDAAQLVLGGELGS
jgi:hypothetical protein